MKLDLIAIDHPCIATDRLVLRGLRKSDATPCAIYAGDRRVADTTRSIPHPLPPEEVDTFIARGMAGESEKIWAIDGSGSGLPEFLGVISLKPMDRGQSEVGFWVAPEMWNAGIASEAVKALIAANPLKNCTIFAEVFQGNPGSARVLTNAGFVYLGDARMLFGGTRQPGIDLDLCPKVGCPHKAVKLP